VHLFVSDAATAEERFTFDDVWPAMLAGAGIFGGGLLVGWLTWG
jgi:hypothetical protein